ncbi:hypothetical protein FHG87_016442 [Trinorchestia longiramus]|nr:hypothetical protein FHG87_016442 [Trinorchestia longiramus]
MRLVELVLFIVVGAGIAKNTSSEPTSVPGPTPPPSNSLAKLKASSSPRPPKLETKVLTTTLRPQKGTGIPSSSLLTQEGAEISTTTLRAPVYIPSKEKEAQTTKVTNIRKEIDAEKPSIHTALKKVAEEQVLQKKSPETKNDSTELAERNDVVAENKEGFFSAVNFPLAASIGAAIMFGGLAYYMQTEPEPISSRQGIPPHLGYDHGVRIVHPSDLTPAELDRLVNVGGYHISGRSITHSSHPYFDYAKRVYKYIMPEILGGSSKEDELKERVYIIRHHPHQKTEHEKEVGKSHVAIEGANREEKQSQILNIRYEYWVELTLRQRVTR